MDIGHNLDLLRNAVKDQQTIRNHQCKIRKIQTLFVPLRKLFQIPDKIITQVAHRAAEKTRQSLYLNRPILGHNLLYYLEGVGRKGEAFRPAVADDLDAVSLAFDDDGRI